MRMKINGNVKEKEVILVPWHLHSLILIHLRKSGLEKKKKRSYEVTREYARLVLFVKGTLRPHLDEIERGHERSTTPPLLGFCRWLSLLSRDLFPRIWGIAANSVFVEWSLIKKKSANTGDGRGSWARMEAGTGGAEATPVGPESRF